MADFNDDANDFRPSGGKKRVIRKKKDGTGSEYVDPTEGVAPQGDGSENVQVVRSAGEADALVKRLKQLEGENASLASSLAKICDDNARLSNELSVTERKMSDLASQPFKGTSVLRSLFEPEKAGWFGGSKTAARDQLEKMCEALQKEFTEYKATHPTTSEEFQTIVTELRNAHANTAELSKIIDEQQKALSTGPYACVVRIIPFSGDVDGVTGREMQSVAERLRDQVEQLKRDLANSRAETGEKVLELNKCQRDLAEAKLGGTGTLGMSLNDEMEVQRLKDAKAHLEEELKSVREALATETKLRAIKAQACEEALAKLDRANDELDELRSDQQASQQLQSANDRAVLQQRERQLTEAQEENKNIQKDLQALRAQLASVTSSFEKTNAGLQGKIEELRQAITEKDRQLARSVSADTVSKLEFEKNSLVHELSLFKSRVARLETKGGGDGDGDGSAMDDAKALTIISSQKEYISRLEFEREQWQTQLDQAKAYALERDKECQRVERSAAEDKQRVSFLLKKCAAATAEQRSVTAQFDTLKENFEKIVLELKQEKRKTEELAELQQRVETMRKEKQQQEERLKAVDELEEKLVKAKETIAYMELEHSSAINMSQFAAVKAEKDRLENVVGPLKRQLEESKKEVERLKATTDAQQSIVVSQKANVQGWQDQVNTLTESDARMKEKIQKLTAENERLMKVNESLESQMSDMQGGIKEMAVQMEKERTNARRIAEENNRKEIEELKKRLETANDTIGSFRASEGQFVAEGLYQSVVAERDKLAEEVKRKTSDLEKHKSEILIYRQTITDLEAENDEHVKSIEALQTRYQKERGSLSDRVNTEQKRIAELSGTVDALQAQLKAQEEQAKKDAEALADVNERLARQKRAFEDKCRREEELSNELQTLRAQQQGSSTPPRSSTTAVDALHTPVAATSTAALAPSSPAPVSPPPDAAGGGGAAAGVATADMNKKVYQMQCEIDKLRAENKRLNLKIKVDFEDDQRTINMLQTQLKSRMNPSDRSAYEAELGKVAALKKSNETLLMENESLKQQLAKTDGGSGTMYHTPLLAGGNGDGVASLQKELQEERARYKEMEQKFEEELASLDDRIQELEDELDRAKQEGGGGGNRDNDDGGDDPLGGGDAPKPAKKKVKKIKKKKTLAEQVNFDDVDVLATPSVTAALTPNDEMSAEIGRLRGELDRARSDLAALQEENATLKETIASLTQEVEQARDDLTAAETEMDAERTDLQARIRELEADVKNQPGNSSRNATPNTSFARSNVQQLEMQMRCLKDENEKLRTATKDLEYKLQQQGSATATSSNQPPDIRRMRKQLQQKDAEIKALSEQLMPTKSKLVEYMAMADRLGLQYPFPPELEGSTVLRLQALHIQPARALSAPATGGVQPPPATVPAGTLPSAMATASAMGSPGPRRPARRTAARSGPTATVTAPEDEFSLL